MLLTRTQLLISKIQRLAVHYSKKQEGTKGRNRIERASKLNKAEESQERVKSIHLSEKEEFFSEDKVFMSSKSATTIFETNRPTSGSSENAENSEECPNLLIEISESDKWVIEMEATNCQESRNAKEKSEKNQE